MKSFLLSTIVLLGVSLSAQAQDLEIICPTDVTVECSDVILPGDIDITGGLEPYDVQMTESDVDNNCTITRTYTWIVTDANLDEVSCQQIVTIVDTTPPEFEFCPQALEIECMDDLPTALAEASDNCSDVTVVYFEEYLSENGCGFVIERTYTATDECGNQNVCVQMITGLDFNCNDPLACNYNSNAETNDDCVYPSDPCNDSNINTGNDQYDGDCNCVGSLLGCTDSLACNYESTAELDDGSCQYPYDTCTLSEYGTYDEFCDCQLGIQGKVFIDEDFNGSPGALEIGLPFQTITIEELDIQLISNDVGEFSFTPLPEGTYTITVNYSAEWESYTTELSQIISVPQSSNDPVFFGVTDNTAPLPTECVDFYQTGAGVPCNDFLNYNICYRNMSPYAVSGVIEVQLDDLLQFASSVPAADSIVGQSVFWSFQNQQSWVLNMDDLLVQTPTEESIGEIMFTTAIVYVWHEGELIEVVSETIEQMVTCAYDPNDITVIPEGYTDDHLVLPETTLEYVIRFQNTGNAPATNVLVVDTLDPGMDFSTFQFVANSHSVMTTVEPSGRVEFFFENIMLPDSTVDEPGSHGLVSFKIDMIEGIEIGQELNATAYIFFDNNPPVITNTTWTTIHACGDEAVFEASSEEICEGSEVDFTSTYPTIESYSWEIEGEAIADGAAFTHLFDTAGDYVIDLVATNPLCSDSASLSIYVEAPPIADVDFFGEFFTATDAAAYQWYLNGEALAGEINQSFDPSFALVNGDNIYVILFSPLGCSAQSETIVISGVEEFQRQKVTANPNPMRHSTWLDFADNSLKSVQLINAQGKLVRTWDNITNSRLEIEKGDLGSGAYVVRILQAGNLATINLVIE